MLKFVLPILIALSFPLEVLSGQFGLEVGETVKSIRKKGVKLSNDGGYWYITDKLPKGNPKLDNYSLLITPVSGLCRIVGRTTSIQTNSFGDQLKSKFEFFETALNKKYGVGKKYDFVKYGSIWDEEKYWMMGLYQKERSLTSIWNKEKDNLPSHLNYIVLDTHASTTYEGVVSLNYEFINTDKCYAEQDAADTDNL